MDSPKKTQPKPNTPNTHTPINQMVKQNRNPNLKEKEPYQQPSTLAPPPQT